MPHLPTVKPDEIQLDGDRLEVAYRLLDKWTKGNEPAVPGGAILVGRHGKAVAARYFGKQGPEPGAEPIRRDGIFLLASITKPLTYMAGLMLVERGLLGLSERVASVLPDFAAHHKEEVLINQLFTHTSGLPDMLPNNHELRKKNAPLKTFVRGAIRDTVPLFPAGTQQSYQSMGTLVVAELIQQLTGKTIHEVLREEIFRPLGLRSTALGSRGLEEARLVRVETPAYQEPGASYSWNRKYWREMGAPWGAGFSTPEDFAVICQAMLNGGSAGDVRLLSHEMVRVATTNRMNDYPQLPESVRRTKPWGLGWKLNHAGTPGSWSDLLDRDVFGHTGATGTMVWIDRRRNGFCILFTTALRSKAPWRLVRLSNIIASAFR